MRVILIAAGTVLLGLASVATLLAQVETVPEPEAPGWPGFRGVGGLAHAPGAKPPRAWNAETGENILWQTEIARHGMSSPVVAGRKLFLTAADDLVRQVLCHDTETGEELWHHDVEGIPGSPEQELPRVLEETGFAAPTPVTDGRYVAAVFATGELVCVNMKGERVWAKHLGVPKNHYGHASSLLRSEDLLIVQYDDKTNPRLLAFDLATGEAAWEVKRDAISWSSPILVDNGGRMEVVVTNSKEVDGYDPKTGKHLWRVECLAGEVATSAAYADGVVFVASEGATAAAIDISTRKENPEILWKWEDSLPDAASPLATKDYLILPTAFGLVTCLNAKTGEVFWEHEFDEGFSSSPILADGCVYLVDMRGTTRIFKLDKAFESLGEGPVGEPVYATPAYVDGRIYLRGLSRLFGIAGKK